MAEEAGGAEEMAVVGAGDAEGQIVVAGAAYEEEGQVVVAGAAYEEEGQVVVAGAAYEEEGQVVVGAGDAEGQIVVAGAAYEEEGQVVVAGAAYEEEGQVVVAGAAYEEEGQVVVAGAAYEEEGQIVVAGAAYEEEETGGGGGGGTGGDEGIFRGDDEFIPPPGFRFRPSDDELIRYYLLPKLQGREYVPNRAIIEHNVYQCHPDQLVGKYMDRGEGKSFYFLSPRVRRYDNGERPRRDTDDGRGRWKVSTGKREKEEKKLAGDGTTYCFSVLNYFESPRGGGRKSDWLMRELTVPGYEIKLPKDGGPGGKTLDRYVMCKIYLRDDKGDDDEEAGPSSGSPLRLHGPVEGDEGATAELPKLSKKLAVKRPLEDEQHRSAAAGKKKRAHHSKCLQLEAPPQGNGMQAPFSTPGPGCYGGSGQPMGYHAGTPTPRQLLAYNNGQVHVPRQQAAYNGQMPVMTRRPAAYNGQVPVMARQPAAYNGQMPVRQPAAYNGQVPVMTRQPAAYNGQVPVRQQQVAFNGQVRPPPYRLAGSPNSYGQNQTTMTRPSCPAGQAVNPEVQRQPETDEMLEKQVLQQNLEEHLRMQSEIHPAQHHHHQQRQMAFTQQQEVMAFTQQQQLAMASTHQQQQAMAFMMRQQQQWRMSFMLHQQQQYHRQQQQQHLGGTNANYHHHAGAMGPHLSLDEAAQRYERSRVVLPATSGGSPGEAATVKAEGSPVSTVESVEGNEQGCNNNGGCSSHVREEESAVVKVSPGGVTAPASASASAEGDGADGTQHA